MTPKAKIAIVGTGWWATHAHIPALLENPRAEMVLVDKNPAAVKAKLVTNTLIVCVHMKKISFTLPPIGL